MKNLNKKAQAMSLVQAVMIAFLVLSVVAITIALSVTELRDVTDKVNQLTATFTNRSTDGSVTEVAPPTNLTGSNDFRNCVLTVTQASSTHNSSCAPAIDATNYSVVSCGLNFTSTSATDAGCYNDSQWNITGSIVYNDRGVDDLSKNLTSGVSDFFNDTGTIFSILIVVLIILAIALIIAVVSRFRSTGDSAGGISGSGRGSDDTVTGA